jgi:hypothetical protein
MDAAHLVETNLSDFMLLIMFNKRDSLWISSSLNFLLLTVIHLNALFSNALHIYICRSEQRA